MAVPDEMVFVVRYRVMIQRSYKFPEPVIQVTFWVKDNDQSTRLTLRIPTAI